MITNNPNPTDVLFGFAGWLTSRKERITWSGSDEATSAADAVAEFAYSNGYGDVSDDFPKNLTYPSYEFSISLHKELINKSTKIQKLKL